MAEVTEVELVEGYVDSVTLMQVSSAVAATPGVLAAQVAMGTELNLEVLRGMGFELPERTGPADIVVALRAESAEALEAGRQAVRDELASLSRRTPDAGAGAGETAPRTLARAAERGAGLALVSVPGEHAAVQAWDALRAGMHVMVFSDNVAVEDEVALKDAAAEADLLVMGPDCGTAVVAGAALGFANAVRRGPVGVVAASGTGAQQVMCLLDAAGVGMSHCLGLGGRDLSAAVGGRSARQALAALDDDPGTSSIVVVSKPPAPEVRSALVEYAGTLGTPVHWATLSPDTPDLTASLEAALDGQGLPTPEWPSWVTPAESHAGPLRGLYCGGTLADEAMLLASPALGGIRSNIPLEDALAVGESLDHDGHLVLDFGEDDLTRGRAHPMIDPTLRLERIARELADDRPGVLLLDLVLGHGGHPDPAPALADAVRGAGCPVVVALVGTPADPQDLDRSARLLQEAGASVFLSNAQAVRHALSLLEEAR
ncbi:FdrA family protein [Nocardioides rotundus]|uniref:FdrA family protein n=1 Tax=Nocardioides rotundus TaxID=1774216 RepID=UPI001CBBD105|nr:FdrA family protein [Nocardioides rotundus]UAL28434.1 FdrA family protein [Nocardioides rotundus]